MTDTLFFYNLGIGEPYYIDFIDVLYVLGNQYFSVPHYRNPVRDLVYVVNSVCNKYN